mmetsp:Transcript_37586/g.66073  ORF Transcript_37586/g.66073 Transcript_37586/m.66073 type:complete len:108 (+) Transcript_37586:651-974(+)
MNAALSLIVLAPGMPPGTAMQSNSVPARSERTAARSPPLNSPRAVGGATLHTNASPPLVRRGSRGHKPALPSCGGYLPSRREVGEGEATCRPSPLEVGGGDATPLPP